MFSTNARRAMGAGAGFIFSALAWDLCAKIFGWYEMSMGPAAWFGTIFAFTGVGIASGLMFERSTRAGYEEKVKKNPEIAAAMDKRFGHSAIIAYILAAFWMINKLSGLLALMALHSGLIGAARVEVALVVAAEAVIGLVLLALYFERGQSSSTPNVKKHMLIFAIFFLALAAIDGAALAVPVRSPVVMPFWLPDAMTAKVPPIR